MKSISLLLSLAASSAFAALPSVGPDYHRPVLETPSAFRDAGDASAWKTATPSDASIRGEWWKIFGDPALDELESRSLAANQDLKAAAARVEQAAAAAGFARSSYWPEVAVNPS